MIYLTILELKICWCLYDMFVIFLALWLESHWSTCYSI